MPLANGLLETVTLKLAELTPPTVATRVIVLDNEKIVYDGDKYELFKDEDFILNHSLDLPEIVRTLKDLSKKLNININIYQDNVEDAAKEIVEAMKHE